ncbi:MAG: hypothetical protein EBU33_11140 [Sphingobacteriia bacterium]|jgi:hypothetical protein|nr:hypothetical protein [Sphingobacteriia bacterium]|tara:strand:+ start:1563 stop:1763 length:201 start_codon:yes stop_codon:yes gene_type:complete
MAKESVETDLFGDALPTLSDREQHLGRGTPLHPNANAPQKETQKEVKVRPCKIYKQSPTITWIMNL